MSDSSAYDALMIGAGPAGSAAGAVLAEKGHRVLIVEREKFPRYHIGESLLPFTFHPLQRLGLIEKMRESHFVRKFSVQFVSPGGKASQPFYFFNRYDRETVAQTWQVLRSEFDVMLLDNARSRGAHVLEQTEVTQLLKDQNGVVAGARIRKQNGSESEVRAKVTIDCSGKESFAMVRQGWRVPDPFLNKVAVWTYYIGAKRDSGIDEGTTTVAYVPEKGWFWYIPQHDNRVSVGVVAEGKYLSRGGIKSPEQIFKRELDQNRWVKEQASAGMQTGPYYLTSEFTSHSRYCASDGLVLAGDAFCFLDPVFSSGVMFALKSGVMAGDAVHEALVEGDVSAARFTQYGKDLRLSIENMRKLVYAFYDENFSFRSLTDKYPEASGLVTDCLSGDVGKDFSQLWKWIEEFASLPPELPVGGPSQSNG
jgi:flavin-dependent dehydrogenase